MTSCACSSKRWWWLVALALIIVIIPSSSALVVSRPRGNHQCRHPPPFPFIIRQNFEQQRQARTTLLRQQPPGISTDNSVSTSSIISTAKSVKASLKNLVRKVSLGPSRWLSLWPKAYSVAEETPPVKNNTTVQLLSTSSSSPLFHINTDSKSKIAHTKRNLIKKWFWICMEKPIHIATVAKSTVWTKWDTFVQISTSMLVATIESSQTSAVEIPSVTKEGDETVRVTSTGATMTTVEPENGSSSSSAKTSITITVSNDRWAMAAPSIDFSGKWKPMNTPEFRKEYEQYLEKSGRPWFMRNVGLKCAGSLIEVIDQRDNQLEICSVTPVGVYNRTLINSGVTNTMKDNNDDDDSVETLLAFEPFNVTFNDPDNDIVHVESWWEQDGTIHRSFLRGKSAGVFESTRYLDKEYLICESRFHPTPNSHLQPAFVKWTYQRQ